MADPYSVVDVAAVASFAVVAVVVIALASVSAIVVSNAVRTVSRRFCAWQDTQTPNCMRGIYNSGLGKRIEAEQTHCNRTLQQQHRQKGRQNTQNNGKILSEQSNF